MNILFIHRNFPGQFAHLAPALAARPGCRVMAIGEGGVADPARRPAGVPLVLYRASRPASGGHRFLRGTDLAVRRGEAVARVAETIRRDFKPDVVVAHIGWGEASICAMSSPTPASSPIASSSTTPKASMSGSTPSSRRRATWRSTCGPATRPSCSASTRRIAG